MKTALIICLLLSFSFGAGPFFVSPDGNDLNSGTTPSTPWQSLEKARNHIRENSLSANLEGDLIIYLMNGRYDLEAPFILNDLDGGSNGFDVVYKALPGADPIFDGGIRLENWSLFENSKGIWKAKLPISVESRQFYVNGMRATRARSKSGLAGATRDDISVKTTDTSMVDWKNHSDLEMVYHQIFTNPRCGVDTITKRADTAYLQMKQPGYSWCRNKGMTSVGTPWYAENAYELLDSAGEWYLDRTGQIGGEPFTLYYIPRAGESLNNAETVLARAESLLRLEGRDVDHPIKNVRIEGITFQYSTWNQPSGNLAHPDAQNNIIRRRTGEPGVIGEHVVPGAVEITWAQNIKFKFNTIQHIGSTGFLAIDGCQFVELAYNLVTDISGTGVHFGRVNWEDVNTHLPTDPRYEFQFNKVINNVVTWVGVEYRSATGIAAAYPVHMEISHNEVGFSNYSGISIGWGWVLGPTCMRNNAITYNYVHDTMRALYDGASIYTLGMNQGSADSTSLIAYNYLKNSHGGVYNDEASSFYKIQSNVGTFTGEYMLWQQSQAPLAPHDNQADSFMVNQEGFKNNGINCSIKNTIPISSNYTSMPERARQIIDSSGPVFTIKEEYQPPISLQISNNEILEGQNGTILVGTLEAADSNPEQFIWYELVNGTGDLDNSKFMISNDSLFAITPLSYKWSPLRTVRVRASNVFGLWLEKEFIINLLEPVVAIQKNTNLNIYKAKWVYFDLLGKRVQLGEVGDTYKSVHLEVTIGRKINED